MKKDKNERNPIHERISQAFYLLKKDNKMTQESFGEKAGLSKSMIINMLYDRIEPNERNIKRLCNAHHINLHWVMTGEGKMFEQLTEDEELACMLGELLSDEEPTFKKRFIKAFLELTPEQIEIFENFVMKLADQREKNE